MKTQQRPPGDTRPAAAALVELIFTVSDADRDLLLVMLDGSTQTDAARRLGITRFAVKTRLQRIRRRAQAVTS